MTNLATLQGGPLGPNTVYSTKEAAVLLGLSHRTLAQMRLDGSGPRIIRIGNRVLYRLCDLSDFIEGRAADARGEDR